MLRVWCNGKKDYCDSFQHCDETCRFYDGTGSKYVEHQTNADRIRAMSDAELALFLAKAGASVEKMTNPPRTWNTAVMLAYLRRPADAPPPAPLACYDREESGLLEE